MSLLDVEDLRKEFAGPRGSRVRAVDGVSLRIGAGETLGLIGESGSGKSTTGRMILRLIEPDHGSVVFDGVELLGLGPRELRRRRPEFQVVFQEPFQSLNPRLTVGAIVEEPLIVARRELSRTERQARVAATLEEVGLRAEHADRRPADLSGGQQQRVGIARALVNDPRFVVLDEPTSSLDLTVRAAILQTLSALRTSRGLAYLFISHDIDTVRHFCDRTAVMYLGRIVESGPTAEVLGNPRHPYTRALLSAALSIVPGAAPDHEPLRGDPPSPTDRPAGCALAGRCAVELASCATTPVALRERTPGHDVACLREDLR